MVGSKIDPLGNGVLLKKGKCLVDSFSFASVYLVLFLGFLLVSGVWLVVATMNENVWKNEEMINLINNVITIFIFVVMTQTINI
jgi:hypothetical protein